MKLNRLVRCSFIPRLLVILFVLPISHALSQTWTSQESGTFGYFSAVQFLDTSTGWIAGAYGMILKTTNGGTNWAVQNSGTGFHFSDEYFLDENTGWAVGEHGIVVKTIDGGLTWTPQTSGTTSWLNRVRFIDGQTGWAAGENGSVIKTTNGGATWVSQPVSFTETIEGGAFTSADEGWLACDDGCILKTNNGGASWATQSIVPPEQLNAVTFANPLTGWVVGSSGKILKTTNGGTTWTEQTSGTTQVLNEVSFVNADTGWAVGNYGAIIVTFDGGATWQPQTCSTYQNFRSVFFADANHGWAVGLNNVIQAYSGSSPLPIQLSRFTARTLGENAVRLDWTTISETNNYGFNVQRSASAHTGFETVQGSFVPGNGTTNAVHNYGYTDQGVSAGRVYYRLQQIDLDGTVHYTEPVSVDNPTGVAETALPVAFSLRQNYPNPFNPSTNIEFSVAKTGFVSLKVYDMLGKEVATIVNGEMNRGTYTRTLSGERLSSGTYIYKLEAGSFTATKKLVYIR